MFQLVWLAPARKLKLLKTNKAHPIKEFRVRALRKRRNVWKDPLFWHMPKLALNGFDICGEAAFGGYLAYVVVISNITLKVDLPYNNLA